MKKITVLLLFFTLMVISVPMVSAQSVFDDVNTMHINRDAVEWLREHEVVEGYDDGTYKPENRINRAEFIKIIVASLMDNSSGTNCFPDVKDAWFAKYICTAKRLGYVKGHPDGTFKPGDYINFAEASQIVTKAFGIQLDNTGTQGEWFGGYVKGLANKKAIPSSVQFFDKDLTRGEMAEMIWRLETENTDKVSQDYVSLTQEFPALSSCEALKEKFAEYQSLNFRAYMIDDAVFMENAESVMAPMAVGAQSKMAESPASEAVLAEDFSTTNIQVAGVDEADIIKNDGKYIYMLKDETVRIAEAYPPSVMKEIGRIDLIDDAFSPIEMFVYEDRLVIIGLSWRWGGRGAFHGTKSKVFIYDISDRSKPELERAVAFDGSYYTSRRIRDDMYIVLNSSPDVWYWDDVRTGEDLLPQMKDGDNAEEPMALCADIHYFPGHWHPNYLIAASIPLDDPKGEIDREVFIGASENVYSSRNSLYVATTERNYDLYTDWDWRSDHTNTLIFKFALEDGKIEYKNRGRVSGNILNQFSMDEYQGDFRIATTSGNIWNDENPSVNNVYILDEEMENIGQIEGIAPGEKIYSTRFLGDRLYMVTFRQVDPLFVIDLSEPTTPKILGKLKIPGFSDYIHPFDEEHIIGFGKETSEDEKGIVRIEGFKMALFDVSDVEYPVQKFVEIIGDRGTDSELLRNHKALLFDKEKELLAFPVNIVEKADQELLDCGKYRYSTCPSLCQKRCIPTSCEVDDEGRAECTDDCEGPGSCSELSYEGYNTTFSGAVVYTLNAEDGFNLRGRVTHYDDEDLLKYGDYFPYNYDKNIQRIIYIGEYLYSISQSMIKANTMENAEDVGELELED